MTEFLQQLINGLALGAIYALIALGYTMVYGILRFINFAHGDVFMLGAFAGLFFTPVVERVFPPQSYSGGLVVLLLAMAVCAGLGILIEMLAYRPLRNRPKLTVLITAIGVSLFIEYTCQHRLVFGAAPRKFPDLIPVKTWNVDLLVISSTQVIVFVTTLLLLVILRFIVQKTRMGTAMRAVSFNEQAAALMGVNINSIISFTFGLGSALAAAGGILFAMSYASIDPLMGVQTGLKAFVAAVVGGIGNLPGAALGGLLIGVIETFAGGIPGLSNYRDGIAFTILIAVLIFRPTGLLSKPQVEKV
ncbi:MAG TPA: branched-chain amino acid ABC transporter permease [Verrucomicrobiota bacterium]|nr:branched-chain amino acid ABC transporter permease [Verrucomicrobiota bacterium]HNT15163.1 branched-chain amino acid ABC transporter permease [Verrucomicrobiota bacterium]